MGAIQGAINQAMTSVGAAAFGINEIKNKAIAQGEAAAGEVESVGKETEAINEEIKANAEQFANVQKEGQALADLIPSSTKSPEDSKAWKELYQGVAEEGNKAILAKAVLQGRLNAALARADRIQKAMNKGRKWGGHY